jgi:acyl-CoA thioesterase II
MSLADLVEVFDVAPAGTNRYVGGSDSGGGRDMIDASQVLAQGIVAAAKSVPTKVVRRASGVFCRPVRANEPVDFAVDVVQDGRTFGTVIVLVSQQGKSCATITVMLDVVSVDVIRHPVPVLDSSPDDAIVREMPLLGREVRLVGVADPNDPDHVGPPRIEAWLKYDQIPQRTDLARALLAQFTGPLSISTTMRAHKGVGTAMAHKSISTAVMAIGITFHDPVTWDDWLLYDHESTSVGSGMSYVRGQIHAADGRLLASFSQDGMIRPFAEASGATSIAESGRL